MEKNDCQKLQIRYLTEYSQNIFILFRNDIDLNIYRDFLDDYHWVIFIIILFLSDFHMTSKNHFNESQGIGIAF